MSRMITPSVQLHPEHQDQRVVRVLDFPAHFFDSGISIHARHSCQIDCCNTNDRSSLNSLPHSPSGGGESAAVLLCSCDFISCLPQEREREREREPRHSLFRGPVSLQERSGRVNGEGIMSLAAWQGVRSSGVGLYGWNAVSK